MYKKIIAFLWNVDESSVIRLSSGEFSIKSPKYPSGFKKIETKFHDTSVYCLSPLGYVNMTEISHNLMRSI